VAAHPAPGASPPSSLESRSGGGVAVREFPLQTGYADYLLFFDRKPASETPWNKMLWI